MTTITHYELYLIIEKTMSIKFTTIAKYKLQLSETEASSLLINMLNKDTSVHNPFEIWTHDEDNPPFVFCLECEGVPSLKFNNVITHAIRREFDADIYIVLTAIHKYDFTNAASAFEEVYALINNAFNMKTPKEKP